VNCSIIQGVRSEGLALFPRTKQNKLKSRQAQNTKLIPLQYSAQHNRPATMSDGVRRTCEEAQRRARKTHCTTGRFAATAVTFWTDIVTKYFKGNFTWGNWKYCVCNNTMESSSYGRRLSLWSSRASHVFWLCNGAVIFFNIPPWHFSSGVKTNKMYC